MLKRVYEQLVTKDYGTLPNLMNIISKTIFLLGIFVSAIILLFGIPFFLIFIILEISNYRTFVEYEYEYFDGELVIAKIYNKKRRKKIISIAISGILKVSQPNNVDRTERIVRCTLKNQKLKEIVIFANDNKNQRAGYLIGMDDELHTILKRVNSNLFSHI